MFMKILPIFMGILTIINRKKIARSKEWSFDIFKLKKKLKNNLKSDYDKQMKAVQPIAYKIIEVWALIVGIAFIIFGILLLLNIIQYRG